MYFGIYKKFHFGLFIIQTYFSCLSDVSGDEPQLVDKLDIGYFQPFELLKRQFFFFQTSSQDQNVEER